MISLFLGFLIVLLILLIYMVKRADSIFEWRSRLLEEESQWLEQEEHLPLWAKHGRFMRHESLPSYDRMVFSFWRPISSFEKELRPLLDYYLK